MSTRELDRIIEARETSDGAGVRLRRSLGSVRGLDSDPFLLLDEFSSDPLYLDIRLAPNSEIALPVPARHRALVYMFEGDARIGANRQRLSGHCAGMLSPGDQVTLTARGNGARMLLLAGKPIGEPVAQYGPFVMNTREEIEQAIADYRGDRLTA